MFSENEPVCGHMQSGPDGEFHAAACRADLTESFTQPYEERTRRRVSRSHMKSEPDGEFHAAACRADLTESFTQLHAERT